MSSALLSIQADLARIAGDVERLTPTAPIQPAATFDWNAHDDATALLRDLHGTVTGTGLHSCHVTLPQSLGSGASSIIPYPGPWRQGWAYP